MRSNTRLKGPMLVLAVAAMPTACATVDNSPGRPGYYSDPREPSVTTLNIDSQDIIEAARTAVPDMLASPEVMSVSETPRIAVDGNEFRNLSFDPTAVQAFSGRLRTELQRASSGRVIIINPERGRNDGSAGNADLTPPDYDLCLAGEITSTLQPPDAHGRRSSSYQVIFELYRPGTREVVWSKPYDIKKVAQEPGIYR